MRSFAIGLILVIAWLMSSPASADIGFEFPSVNSEAATALDDGSIERIQLNDRTWAALGVEDSSSPLPPPKEFDFAHTPQRFRCEYVNGAMEHHSYVTTFPYCHRWVDEFAWPLTRQLFHRSEQEQFFEADIVHFSSVPFRR